VGSGFKGSEVLKKSFSSLNPKPKLGKEKTK
jgi:hypothetical protein